MYLKWKTNCGLKICGLKISGTNFVARKVDLEFLIDENINITVVLLKDGLLYCPYCGNISMVEITLFVWILIIKNIIKKTFFFCS